MSKTLKEIELELTELQDQIVRVIEERQRLEKRLVDKVKNDNWAEIIPVTAGALHFVYLHLNLLNDKRRELREQKRQLSSEHCECCSINKVELDT